MISGNKKIAFGDVQTAAICALKSAFGNNFNWESKSCERALTEFATLCVRITEAVLSDMKDCGDVGYVKGKPSVSDMKRGAEVAREYYLQRPVSMLEARAEAILGDDEKWDNGELGASEEHAVVSERAKLGTIGQQSYYDKKMKLFFEAFTHNIKLLTVAWKASEQNYFKVRGKT